MRKFMMIAVVAAAALGLGGCAKEPGQIAGQVNTTIAQVQEIARTTCSFLPTVSTVANVLSSGSFASLFAVADAICQAVAPASTIAGRRMARRTPVVNGVVIRGRFV